jgi:glycosyltransferase involved in cell wall biosynthesis
MRIAILNLLYSPIQVGGAEKAVKLLAEALTARGDQVSVISLHPAERTTVEQINGVRVYRLPLDNLYWPFKAGKRPNPGLRLLWQIVDVWNVRAARRVARILDELRPDVVHTNTLSGFSVSVWNEVKRRNIRIVHTLHDYYLLCIHPGMFRDGKSCDRQCLDCKAMSRMKKDWSHKVDAVVSVSQAVLATHRKCGYFVDVPGSVIYNIQEPAHDRGPSVSPAGAKGDGGLVFGFIGAITERKGIEHLLKATRLLSNPDWKLRIAGSGSETYVAKLRRSFPDSRIEWLGFASADSFYPSVNVVIVPSVWQDPLPYVVLETYAYGKSLICAQSGGLPELASLGRRVAMYCSTNIESLAQTMDEALANKSEWRDGGFADGRSTQAFAEEVIVRHYRSVYAGSGMAQNGASGASE